MIVNTAVQTLDAGDYSIIGREHEIRIERKSPGDLFQTLTHGRDRFERELERLAVFPFSCVIVEGEFRDLVTNPPSKMLPRSFVGSLVALTTRYRSMWYFAGDRRFAELLAFRLLERWHKDRTAEAKPKRQRRATA
jgi:ERCC4-type nuclease